MPKTSKGDELHARLSLAKGKGVMLKIYNGERKLLTMIGNRDYLSMTLLGKLRYTKFSRSRYHDKDEKKSAKT